MTDDPREIYLDYAATTPLDPAARDAMLRCLDGGAAYGNPASVHVAGRRAHAVIEEARASIAALIGAAPDTVVFTSGATEADNLAIIGGARFREHRGRHLVTVSTEHRAVLAPCEFLQKQGFDVTRLAPAADGLVAPERLAEALRPDTQLVSVMHVNNETGVIQDIEAIGAICRERDVMFHVDAAQSVGKLPLDLRALPVDLLSVSGHKFYGPQGVGALYVAARPRTGVTPLVYGGGQERRLRPGTVPLALVAGLGAAAAVAEARLADDAAHVAALSGRLWDGIRTLDGIRRNGSATARYPGILNVTAPGVDGESLMLALEPLCVASGSACNSRTGEPSAVLKAMGLSDAEAEAAVRFSIGRPTTQADVDAAASRYRSAVERLRNLAPAVA